MVIATNPREEYVFYCSDDLRLDPDKRTGWKILALDVAQRAHLDDGRGTAQINDDGGVGAFSVRTGGITLDCLRAGLRGCVNFVDDKGNDVPFEVEKSRINILGRNVFPPTDDFLGRIPRHYQTEIANAIELNTRVTAEEGKD